MREHRAAVAKAEAALDTASTHGLQTDRYALLVRLGLEEALEESELARLHQSSAAALVVWYHSFVFCLLAEAFARAGLPDGGLAALAEIPEQALETVYAPEVHRCRGSCFWAKATPTHPRQRPVSGAQSSWPVVAVIARSSFELRRA